MSVTTIGDLIDLDRVDPGAFLAAMERARLGSAWVDDQGRVMRVEQVWPWLRRLLPAALDSRLVEIAGRRAGSFSWSGGPPTRLAFNWSSQVEANPPRTPEFAVSVVAAVEFVAMDGQMTVPLGSNDRVVGGDQPGRWSAVATMVLRDVSAVTRVATTYPARTPPAQPEQPFHVTRTESVRLPRLVF